MCMFVFVCTHEIYNFTAGAKVRTVVVYVCACVQGVIFFLFFLLLFFLFLLTQLPGQHGVFEGADIFFVCLLHGTYIQKITILLHYHANLKNFSVIHSAIYSCL